MVQPNKMYDQPLGGGAYQGDGQPQADLKPKTAYQSSGQPGGTGQPLGGGQPGGAGQPLGDGQPGGAGQGSIYVPTSEGLVEYKNNKVHVSYSSEALHSNDGHRVLANMCTTAREAAYALRDNPTTNVNP